MTEGFTVSLLGAEVASGVEYYGVSVLGDHPGITRFQETLIQPLTLPSDSSTL